MAAIAEAYEAAGNGAPRFVLIGGETGIGKSRLLRECLSEARSRKATILEGAAPAVSGQELPYAPIVAALRSLGSDKDPDRLAKLLPPETELSRLLPELSQGRPSSTGDAGAQLRLYEEFLGFLRQVTSGTDAPVVLALEDLHWADASTRGLLAYLVRNLRTGRALVLATYRSTDLNPSSQLQDLVLELGRSESVQQLYLEPLSSAEIEAQVRLLLGTSVPMERVARLERRSGGNPLFVEQLALAEEQGSQEPPRSLVALLLAAVRRLPDDAQALLRLAAVAGVAAPAPVLEVAARALGVELTGAVRAAREAGILRVVGIPTGDAYAYRHPILQEVLYAELPGTERARLHAMLAEILESQLDAGARPDAVSTLELARHWWAAGDLGRAYPALLRAANAAQEMYAFAEAHELYERALQAAQRAPHRADRRLREIGFRPRADGQPPDHAELHQLTAQAASLAGHPDRAVELLQFVIQDTAGDDPAAHAKLGQYLWESGQRDESIGAYRAAIERISDTQDPAQVPVVRAAARALMMVGRPADALPLARQAVAGAREAGLDAEESQGLSTLAACLALNGDVDDAIGALDQRRELDQRRRRLSGIRPRPSRIVDLLSGYWSQATVLERAGHLEESAAVALEGVERARELGAQRGWGGLVGAAAIRELTELGRWSEAGSLLTDLLAGATDSSAGTAELHAAAARLLTLRGDFEGAASQLQAAGALQAVHPQVTAPVALAAGELSLWTAQLTEGARTVSEAVQELTPGSDRLLLAELVVLALRIAAERFGAAGARRLTAERADIERQAADLHGQLIALGGQDGQAAGGRKLKALVETGAAEHHRLSGQPGPGPWGSVAEQWESLRQPYHAAYARWRSAEGLLSSKSGRGEGRDALRTAHATCLSLGAEPLRREIEGLARRARVELASLAGEVAEAVEVEAPSVRRDLGLSNRELEVLMLVSEGWTNRQIAESLFITEKTAGHHVSNILGKLGVASRVEAASVAIRAGAAQSPIIATAPSPARTAVESQEVGRITRTLMFTDIAKSTALVEAIGDEAWSDLIGWHDATLRSLFAGYAGTEVDHAGDGFFIVFADVVAAIDCAIAIQRTLSDHRRRHGFAPRLRIGAHTAQVSKAGEGYKGRGVHEAARIAAAASPDEILVSTDSLGSAGRYARLESRILTLVGLSAPMSVVPIVWRADDGDR